MTGQKETIINLLLVDDDSSFLEVAESILKEMDSNLNIDSVLTVDDAFRKLATKTYDVIISDYEMPKKTGLDFLKELRDNNDKKPFILFTGKGREEIAIQALNLSADRYINKHGNPETVYKELTISIHQLYEKAHAKKMLLESQERLRLFIENAPDAIFISDLQGRLLDQNRQAEQLHGYKKEEILGKDMIEIGMIPPEVASTAKENLKKTDTEQRVGPTEYTLKRKDGTSVVVEVSIFPVKRGKDIEIIGIARDITERKNAEREKEQKFEALERIAQSLDSGLAIIGKDYRVVWANSILQQMGIEGTKHCYEIFNNLESVCPDCGVKKVFEKGVALDVHEYKTQDLTGKNTWIELRVTPLKDKKGNVIAALELAVPIGEHKKAEVALKESEERYAKLSDAAFEGILISRDGKILDSNSQFLNSHQYTLDEIVGKDAEILVAPQSRELVKKNMLSGFEGPYEFMGLRKDGTIFPIEVRAKPLPYKGAPARVSAVQDITQRKKDEEQLLILSSLFELASDAIFVCDLEGNIIYFNEATHLQAGYSREEMAKLSLYEFCSPAAAKWIKQRITQILENKTAVFESEHMRKDKSLFPCEISSRLITSNGKKLLINVARDISDRKKTQETLRKSEERYRIIAENMTDVVTVTDGNGILTYISPSAQNLYGYDSEDLIGKNAFELAHPEDMTNILRPILPLIKSSGEIPLVEFRLRCKNGSYVWIESNGKVVKDSTGKETIIAVARTIEDRKKTEKRLVIVNEKLRIVGKLTRHDVRNKLTTISSTSYLLRKKYANDPELVKYLSSIDSAVAMANRLFDFTAFYEKIGAQEQIEIDIKTCFDEAVALCPNLSNIEILNDTTGLTVVADSLLRQVFYNLIDNSLKHGKTVTQIRLYFKNEGDQTKLIYEDNGMGVSMENKPKIFSERFTTGNGTGLGLSTIKKMMDVYNWTIVETGIPGEGARFEIVIPSQGRVSPS